MEQQEVENQKGSIKKGNPIVDLAAPCRLGKGILQLEENEREKWRRKGSKTSSQLACFIPASGSGSRMFQFLFDYLEKKETVDQGKVEHFLNNLEDFAFFRFLPIDMQSDIKSGQYSPENIIRFILGKEGLNLASMPKGMVPFHLVKPFVLNAFQEQYVQASQLIGPRGEVHFTIQEEFMEDIRNSLMHAQASTGLQQKVSYSYQDKKQAAYAFDGDMELAKDKSGQLIRRPAGHGALISNLNRVEADLILVKNIDNVQHLDKSGLSKSTWLELIGLTEDIQQKLNKLLANFSRESALQFNHKFQLYDQEEFEKATDQQQIELLNRPLRICGMVKNIGQPGGGPYWIREESGLSKQIVEKAQMQNSDEQQALVVKSTHFNPVMMVLSTKNNKGDKFDFTKYVDEEKYFIVNKSHEGQEIVYRELPGLWNGAMAKWNTVFVEVDSDTFSPVKSILDLLSPQHTPQI